MSAILAVLIIIDFMFLDDSAFIFEPDIKVRGSGRLRWSGSLLMTLFLPNMPWPRPRDLYLICRGSGAPLATAPLLYRYTAVRTSTDRCACLLQNYQRKVDPRY